MTVVIPIFKTGQISWFASNDVYGLESSRFLDAVYSLHIDVRFVNFCRCSGIFNFARHWHRLEIFQVLGHLVSRSLR